jgi:hypothetical protein
MVISIQKMANAEPDACDSSCTSRTEGWDTGFAVLAKVSTAEADARRRCGCGVYAAVGMTFLPATVCVPCRNRAPFVCELVITAVLPGVLIEARWFIPPEASGVAPVRSVLTVRFLVPATGNHPESRHFTI